MAAPKSTRFYGSISERDHFHAAAARFVGSFPARARLLDIGTGYRRWRQGVVNVDLRLYPETDVVADAHQLPFADGVFDGVILQGVLAYLADPKDCAAEVARVLKPRGRVYADENFFYPDDPWDADLGLAQKWRFTAAGFAALFAGAGFEEESSGPAMGPASAFVLALRWILALLLSLGSMRLFKGAWHVTGWVVFPLKYLDLLLFERMALARFAAGNCFYHGKKRSNSSPRGGSPAG